MEELQIIIKDQAAIIQQLTTTMAIVQEKHAVTQEKLTATQLRLAEKVIELERLRSAAEQTRPRADTG